MIDTIQVKKTLKIAQDDQPQKVGFIIFSIASPSFHFNVPIVPPPVQTQVQELLHNLSPTQYIMKMRILEACDLLCNGLRFSATSL